MAQCTACASLWDKLSAVTSERQLWSDKFTARLLWFIRSPHHSDTTVLYDIAWPVGTNNELISMKKRLLSEVAVGSVPISYRHTTRKISIIDAGLTAPTKLLAVVFSKLTDETSLAEAHRYLLTQPVEEDSVISFSNGSLERNGNSSSPSEKKPPLYLTSKFGLVFLMELQKYNISFSHCKAIEHFLSLVESEFYASLASSQNGSLTPEFINKADDSFLRFIGNIRNLARIPLISLPVQRRSKLTESSILFVDLLIECITATEKKELHYFVSTIFTLLLKSLPRFILSDTGRNLFEADMTKKQTWLMLGKNAALLKSFIVIINLFMMNLVNSISNGECYNAFGACMSAFVPSYLPFADIQATASSVSTKSIYSNIIYSMNQSGILNHDFCIANSYDWLTTEMNFCFDENGGNRVHPTVVYPSPPLVSIVEKLFFSYKFGASKIFCAEYFMQNSILWSCKNDLISRSCPHSSPKLKAALGCD